MRNLSLFHVVIVSQRRYDKAARESVHAYSAALECVFKPCILLSSLKTNINLCYCYRLIVAITLKDLSTVLPFGDHVDVVDLTGAVLKQVFEYSANRTLFRNETHDTGVHVLHVSGEFIAPIPYLTLGKSLNKNAYRHESGLQ